MATPINDLERVYLPAIRSLAFVKKARLALPDPCRSDAEEDAVLELETTAGRHRLSVEVLSSHLGRPTLGHLGALAARHPGRWMVFAPFVSRPAAAKLAELGLAFIDRAGNLRLALGDKAFASIEGRSPVRAPEVTRGWRAPGLLAAFAYLAHPEWLDAPVRDVANAVGVSKNAAADTRRRLIAEKFVVETREGRKLVDPRRLRERWVAGFADVLWPHLLLGRFRTADPSPQALEERLETVLGKSLRWAWGGGAAAERLVPHFRGSDTTVWTEELPRELPPELRAIPDRDGPLVFLRAPGPLVFEGTVPRTAHPLLVWAELLATGNERAAETASLIFERFGGAAE